MKKLLPLICLLVLSLSTEAQTEQPKSQTDDSAEEIAYIICVAIVVIVFILATQTEFFDNMFKKKN